MLKQGFIAEFMTFLGGAHYHRAVRELTEYCMYCGYRWYRSSSATTHYGRHQNAVGNIRYYYTHVVNGVSLIALVIFMED